MKNKNVVMPSSILGYDIMDIVTPIRIQERAFDLKLFMAVIFFDKFG
jgi:hypothetical protein